MEIFKKRDEKMQNFDNENRQVETHESGRNDEYESGKLYEYKNGQMIEVIFENKQTKLPVTEEALAVVQEVRSRTRKEIGTRLELEFVASAMILKSKDDPELMEFLKKYVKDFYSKL